MKRTWLRAAGSLILLGAVWLAVPKAQVLAGLGRLRVSVLLPVLACYLAVHFLGAWKWRLLVARSGGGISGRDALQCYYYGLFGNLFLPGVAGGDAVMVATALRKGEGRAGIVAGSLVNRMADTAALLILAAIPMVVWQTKGGERVLLTTAGVALVAIAVAGTAVRVVGQRRDSRLAQFVAKHAGALEPLKRPRLMAIPLALSVAMQLGLLALSGWIAAAGGLRVPLRGWLLAWPLAKLAAMVPLAAGGIGTREVALSALLAPFGAPAGPVVATAIAWDGVMIAGSLAGGMIARLAGRSSAGAKLQ
jgi:uncharacterized membrane protein YbhN (UPF0104 family)